jgi:hypothetical protein
MTLFDNTAFTKAVESAKNQPEEAFASLEKLTRELVGVKLFTVMTCNTETGVASRVYTNMPEAYPTSGTKPYNPTYWSKVTLDEHKTFVANTIEDIAEVFDDHELIKSLGCESVINVPITVMGRVVATINCLDEAGHYTEERVKAAEALKLPGAVCVLLQEKLEGMKANG